MFKIALTLIVALLASASSAQSPISGFPPGTFTSRAAIDASGGAAPSPTFKWVNFQDNGFQGAGTSVAIGSTRQNAACNGGSALAAGEVLFARLAIENETTDTITPPAGWTQAGTNQNDGTGFVTFWWHITTAAETCSYTFSWVNSNFMAWTLTSIQGANGVTPIDVAATGTCATGGGTTCNATSVTTVATNTILVTSFDNTTTGTTVTGDAAMTNRISVAQESGTAISNVSTQAISGAGATGTRQVTGQTGKTYVWLMVALTP